MGLGLATWGFVLILVTGIAVWIKASTNSLDHRVQLAEITLHSKTPSRLVPVTIRVDPLHSQQHESVG